MVINLPYRALLRAGINRKTHMAIALSSPVTGAAQTGFTTPAWVHVADQAPAQNAKQYAVTSGTGTIVGVTFHTLASPFTTAFWRPGSFSVLGKPHPVTGLISVVPMNTFKVITRKGVTVQSGQPYRVAMARTLIEIPAGADTADPPNVRALQSMHIGSLSQVSSGLGDTTINGVM
ncbi:TPA_asm: coat protein [ssRNA phage SRR6960549_2]|uniref:Coat protein n=1 Tax=ssRNA phage SRR6960549_2 TaxID=2786539 RepID=A0A8S5L4H6_9VIRU|nr:coat protein [ssRNA phage SRR6960549_2]DAD52592.1 TPA_asm: coat protein [ssRNA phage SRR6960549_2]